MTDTTENPALAGEATDPAELERQIMSWNEPKNEREWWALKEIERLREALTAERTPSTVALDAGLVDEALFKCETCADESNCHPLVDLALAPGGYATCSECWDFNRTRGQPEWDDLPDYSSKFSTPAQSASPSGLVEALEDGAIFTIQVNALHRPDELNTLQFLTTMHLKTGSKANPHLVWSAIQEAIAHESEAFDKHHRPYALSTDTTAEPQPTSKDAVREALEPVWHWYQSDEHPERPLAEVVADVVADLQQDRAWVLNPPKHRYWMPGEPDCPREIKTGNGELHTWRCKVCGQDNPRTEICRLATPAASSTGAEDKAFREGFKSGEREGFYAGYSKGFDDTERNPATAWKSHRLTTTTAEDHADAEVVEVLRELRETLVMIERPSIADPYIVVELRALCERAGYGNVMASTSELWRTHEGAIKGSEFVSGPCRITVQADIARIDALIAKLEARHG